MNAEENDSIKLPLDPSVREAIDEVKRVTGVATARDAIRVALKFTAASFPRSHVVAAKPTAELISPA